METGARTYSEPTEYLLVQFLKVELNKVQLSSARVIIKLNLLKTVLCSTGNIQVINSDAALIIWLMCMGPLMLPCATSD